MDVVVKSRTWYVLTCASGVLCGLLGVTDLAPNILVRSELFLSVWRNLSRGSVGRTSRQHFNATPGSHEFSICRVHYLAYVGSQATLYPSYILEDCRFVDNQCYRMPCYTAKLVVNPPSTYRANLLLRLSRGPGLRGSVPRSCLGSTTMRVSVARERLSSELLTCCVSRAFVSSSSMALPCLFVICIVRKP